MLFETGEDVLHWYDKEERVLTPAFLETIPWDKVKETPLAPELAPVLRYMRDIETFTTMYADELRRTPTGKDPVVKRFMERWETEETLHGELLNRFLNEAGFVTPSDWKDQSFAAISPEYRRSAKLTTSITNLVGKNFSAVHMTWGAIQELSTLSGYERLWHLAEHPVLEKILRAIVREEARHALFYWSLARIRLAESKWRQELAKFLVNHFWTPVGQGAKPKADTDYVIKTVFQGKEGLALMDSRVTKRIQQLPGFDHFTKLTERIAEVVGGGSPIENLQPLIPVSE